MNGFSRYSFLLAVALPIALAACSSGPVRQSGISGERHHSHSQEWEQEQLLAELSSAENNADSDGRNILAMGRMMTVEKKEIVRGSCWDYSNAVYNRSGYPNTKANRHTVFKGTKKQGPYADPKMIRPGDWLYYVNHSYGDIEHSAIFVKWIDYRERTALMLSYGGEKRNEPARYLPYDISHVYQITRPGNEVVEPATGGSNVIRTKYTSRKKQRPAPPSTAPAETITPATLPPIPVQTTVIVNPPDATPIEATTSPVSDTPALETAPAPSVSKEDEAHAPDKNTVAEPKSDETAAPASQEGTAAAQ